MPELTPEQIATTIDVVEELYSYLEDEWVGTNGFIGKSAEAAARAERVLRELKRANARTD